MTSQKQFQDLLKEYQRYARKHPSDISRAIQKQLQDHKEDLMVIYAGKLLQGFSQTLLDQEVENARNLQLLEVVRKTAPERLVVDFLAKEVSEDRKENYGEKLNKEMAPWIGTFVRSGYFECLQKVLHKDAEELVNSPEFYVDYCLPNAQKGFVPWCDCYSYGVWEIFVEFLGISEWKLKDVQEYAIGNRKLS